MLEVNQNATIIHKHLPIPQRPERSLDLAVCDTVFVNFHKYDTNIRSTLSIMITSSIKLQPREQKLPAIRTSRARAKPAPVPRQVKRTSPQKKVIEKKTPVKLRSVKEIAEKELGAKADETRSGQVHLRYNHYNKPFKVHNGVVKWEEVDREYSFSFIFAGDYKRELFHIPTPDKFGRSNGIHGVVDERSPINSDGQYFIEILPGAEYKISITEDADAGLQDTGLRVTDKPLKASDRTEEHPGQRSGNQAVKDITDELLKMDVKDLNGVEARALKEARDVEDLLFSS